MQTVRPFSSAWNDSSTTRSGLSHSSFGVLDSASLPDLAWNSVCVSPGHNACTFTPYGAASSAAALLRDSTNAFVAAYVPRGTQAATDDTLMIEPVPRETMATSAVRVSVITAWALTSNIASSTAGSASR